MKFELVEPPEPPESSAPDASAAQEVPSPPSGGPDAGADSVAGLAVVTERLTAEVAAEIARIDVSVGELIAAVAAPLAQQHNRARPPGNFRPDRFGPAGKDRTTT